MRNSLAYQRMRLLLDAASTVRLIPKWAPLPHNTEGGVSVKEDAFGINVASSEDPLCDDYVVKHLKEAGITHVRLCWDFEAQQNYTRRFLDRLLAEKFDVLVSLVPNFEDARLLEKDDSARARWRQFLQEFFQNYGARVPLCEIGNTPNRPKWSGHTPIGYLKAWEIAAEEANLKNVALAGPNVSDFEPIFNQIFLENMQRSGASPSVHTDNLFVERVVEPERYDPRVFGKLLATPLKLNLAKKISLLSDISARHGIDRTFCTYACWTLKRLNRWTSFGESKGADYLVRYLVICAATEGLDRVYWGPLIDSRDGIIDCGSDDYPAIDNVSHYKSVRGLVEDFSPNPSFFAYKFITNLLKNTFCHQGFGTPHGVNHYIFSDEEHDHHIIWAPDGFVFDATSLYSDHLDTATARDISGKALIGPHGRTQITESPIVLTWDRSLNTPRPNKTAIQGCASFGPPGTVHFPQGEWKPVTIDEKEWRGVAKLPVKAAPEEALAFVPCRIHEYPVLKKLRDKRNRLWSIENPGNENPNNNKTLVIKENRARGIKRFSYLFLDSKGKRHWNTATEMLRRGINTPEPIAYVEQKRFSGIKDNYYIAEFLNDAFSTRDLFTAFSAGEASYRDIDKQEWLSIIAQFVALMHRKGIIHRDLSSGNLMITMNDGKPKVYAIDIGRAQIKKRIKASLDLKRICYKLSWPDRELFIAQYREALPTQTLRYWRATVYGYDLKLIYKRRIKRLLPGRRKPPKLGKC